MKKSLVMFLFGMFCVFQIEKKVEIPGYYVETGAPLTFYAFNLRLDPKGPLHEFCSQIFLFEVSRAFVDEKIYKKKKLGDHWVFEINQSEVEKPK